MATNSSKRRSNQSGLRLPLWGVGLLFLLLAIFLIGSSVWLYRTIQGLVPAVQVTDPDFNGVGEENVAAVADEIPLPVVAEAAEPAVAPPSVQPWSGDQRINFLLMGVDKRCDEEGPSHTDSIMVATVYPLTKSAAILSLPRDMWVEIPDFGVDRINQAYYYGQIYEVPGGGPALAAETVESFLGIPLHYYITVDFDAFVEVVNLIGGIVLTVPEAIDDPSYPDNCYGYEPFHIDAGQQRLDGATALKYARTRATFGGDVDRAARQQQVIMAVRDQVVQLDMIPQLLVRAPQLWQTLQDNVSTNLSLEETLQLALLARELDPAHIRTAVLDYNYVYNETTPDGRQVLVPVRDKIRALRDELFAPPAMPTPQIEALPELMAAEGARIGVYNGTAQIGLAADTQAYLQQLQVNVTEIGNADSATYNTTQIIDYGSHPNTVQFLIQSMQVPPLNVSNGSNPNGDYDVLVILGEDWEVP
jgi:LCP family protein required for cell wall assembly